MCGAKQSTAAAVYFTVYISCIAALVVVLQVRAAVYAAAGLNVRGKPSNCSRAAKVLLRARAGPSYRLAVNSILFVLEI
jgi:hypothetical protein